MRLLLWDSKKKKKWITAPNLLRKQHFEKNISNSNISLKVRIRKISWEVLGATVYPQNNHFGTRSPFQLQYLLSTSLLCLNSITMVILPLYYLWPPPQPFSMQVVNYNYGVLSSLYTGVPTHFYTYVYVCARRTWQPTLVFLPGESPWTEKPGGYSPLGCKESDTTEVT